MAVVCARAAPRSRALAPCPPSALSRSRSLPPFPPSPAPPRPHPGTGGGCVTSSRRPAFRFYTRGSHGASKRRMLQLSEKRPGVDP